MHCRWSATESFQNCSATTALNTKDEELDCPVGLQLENPSLAVLVGENDFDHPVPLVPFDVPICWAF